MHFDSVSGFKRYITHPKILVLIRQLAKEKQLPIVSYKECNLDFFDNT